MRGPVRFVDPTSSARHRVAYLALAWCLCVFGSGCLRKSYPPKQAVVSELAIEGVDAARQADLLSGLATAESAKFLGIWDGVAFEYEVFDPDLLKQDLERIERYLVARGYYEAKVTAALIIALDEHRVRVELRVREGNPVLIRNVSFSGLEALPLDVSVPVLAANPLIPNTPFDEAHYESAKRDVARVLHNLGYAFADVAGTAGVDIANHSAVVHFQVSIGPPCVFGPVRIEGLKEIPSDVVRNQLGTRASLRPGARYSQNALDDARRALVALGVFSEVRVRAAREEASGTVIPLVVNVQESQLRSLGFGLGAALDSLQTSAHVRAAWQHRNFLGGARHLSLELQPGVVLYPTRFGNLQLPNRTLLRSQAELQLRQPSFIESRTQGILTGSVNLFPLLYAQAPADAPIVGFLEVRASAGLERSFWSRQLSIRPGYTWQLELPLDYRHLSFGREVDAPTDLLAPLKIAYPELTVSLDLRDDVIVPHRGAYLSGSVQWASTWFGSDQDDVRVRPEARFFVPISQKVTLATRFVVGLLLHRSYSNGQAVPGTSGAERKNVARDQQTLLFRGFESGGANSNRGYPVGGIGPRGEVLFLTPNARFCQDSPEQRSCNQPLRGASLWEANLEVRFPLWGPLGGIWFVDGSNVTVESSLVFSAPHLSTGLGLRYATPLGPLRLDIGFRLPYLQELGRRYPPDVVYSNPAAPAVHLTLGEAF